MPYHGPKRSPRKGTKPKRGGRARVRTTIKRKRSKGSRRKRR